MNKVLAVLLVCASVSVFACPKGQHLHGGYGLHHTGGYCSC